MIEKKALRELVALVGGGKVFADREYLLAYSYDATGLEYLPDAVVFAENEEDVAAVIAVCRRHAIPLIPRGAGVGYTGGALAVHGGLVLVFTRMNRILRLDEGELPGRRRAGGDHGRPAGRGGKGRPFLSARSGQPEDLDHRRQRRRERRRARAASSTG